MKSKILLLTIISIVTLISCKQNRTSVHLAKEIVRKQPKVVSYTMENTKMWLKQNATDSSKIEIVTAINRTDRANLSKLDSLVIPSDFDGDVVYYLPFPLQVDYLKDVAKVLIFSYPTQTFGAYKNGVLTYSGPTNMGRKKDKTPLGLFFTNWKAEKTTSTFDDEWELKWNFNIENKLGVGFHEYSLPGLPFSHSCLRLLEKDAKFLYEWADEWILDDKEEIKVKGTPVIVFGNYTYDEPKPWLQLIKNPKIISISVDEIEKQTTPFLKEILEQQKIREDFTETATK
ncbi:L,D-transpeptidase [Flavobacterium chungnamense]|uniref:L,D-TPase catalytic domain-containing protein n=1 Tax=Flavobacterium chungnamense TaxID=706182 RepID=A0ABP7UWL8_9FLAO